MRSATPTFQQFPEALHASCQNCALMSMELFSRRTDHLKYQRMLESSRFVWILWLLIYGYGKKRNYKGQIYTVI